MVNTPHGWSGGIITDTKAPRCYGGALFYKVVWPYMIIIKELWAGLNNFKYRKYSTMKIGI
jgi:hypothetical protein